MKTKTIVKTYYPQPVDLPPGIERNIMYAANVRPVEDYKGLSEKDRQIIDTKTLFYDMFFASNYLVCLGPPFYSFGNPLEIKCGGKKLEFKIYHGRNVRVLGVVLIRMDQPSSYDLEFIFQEFAISISYIYKPLPSAKTELTMVTHQKDNSLVWIKDWCSYHTRAYGVERIVLYDNGSKYWIGLAEALTDLNENLNITLINWPYKYGYILSGVNYKYCQPGALHHYHLAFGNQTKWCINLDIDEYLYLDRKGPLKSYLSSMTATHSVLQINQYNFPMGQVKRRQHTRFYHLQYRYKLNYFLSIGVPALKYICQPNKVLIMGVHSATPYNSKVLLEAKAIIFKWKKLFWLLLLRNKRWINLVTFYFLRNKRRERKRALNQIQVKNNPLCFFHFRDLYSDWIKEPKEGDPVKFRNINTVPSKYLTSDRRVIEKAIEVGIINKSDVPAVDKIM